jgi:hypothetical protein
MVCPTSMAGSRPQKRFWSPWRVTLVFLGIALIAFRAALPTLVKNYVNKTLDKIPGYEGHMEEIDIALLRGAYAIRGLELKKVEGNIPVPFFSAETVDFSIEWKELFRGALVGEIEFIHPKLNFVEAPSSTQEQKAIDQSVMDRVKELFPLKINRFALVKGQIHFRNFAANPDIDIFLHDINLVARNLTNSAKISKSLVAKIKGKGRAMKTGLFHIEMNLDPFKEQPTYDLSFELTEFSLPELNTFFKHYLAVRVNDGTLGLYTESAAQEGRFKGYVKPIVRNLDVVKLKEEDKSLGEVVKGFFVKIVAAIFENKSKDQLATKVDFAGSFEDPDVSIWTAVTRFLRNAFIQAIVPGLEGTVDAKQLGVDTKPENEKVQKREEKEERKAEKEQERLEKK